MKKFTYFQKKLKQQKNNCSAMPKKQNLWKKKKLPTCGRTKISQMQKKNKIP